MGAFDFGIPVGAFNQAHRDFAPFGFGQGGQPMDDADGPFLISLNRQAQPLPIIQIRVRKDRFEDIQRHFQALRFLGIDSHRNAAGTGAFRQIKQFRLQFGDGTPALQRFIARI